MTNSNITTGNEALDALSGGNEETKDNKFTSLKSGTTYIVKVPGINLISAFVYNSYNKGINSFIAQNESDKSPKGFPTNNLTPFDKVWKYYKDKSNDWQDKMSQEANNYRAQRKFTLGFYDLDKNEPVMIEFTRKQAGVIVDAIKENDKYLSKFAFKLSKSGKGTSTTVGLTLIPMLDDLTSEQRENFETLPDDFNQNNFSGLYYEMSNEDQLDVLKRVGFDVTKVGLTPNKIEVQDIQDKEINNSNTFSGLDLSNTNNDLDNATNINDVGKTPDNYDF